MRVLHLALDSTGLNHRTHRNTCETSQPPSPPTQQREAPPALSPVLQAASAELAAEHRSSTVPESHRNHRRLASKGPGQAKRSATAGSSARTSRSLHVSQNLNSLQAEDRQGPQSLRVQDSWIRWERSIFVERRGCQRIRNIPKPTGSS